MTNLYRTRAVHGAALARDTARISGKPRLLLKAMVAGAWLAVAMATPSEAQSYDPDLGTGNIVAYPVPAAAAQGARNAYARFERPGARSARVANARTSPAMPGISPAMPGFRAFNSVGPGSAAGSDPDPNIQFQLHRESLQGRW